MYIYDEIFEEGFYASRHFDFYYKDCHIIGEEQADIGVFDIETTGLDPRNGQVIMGALLNRVDGGLRVRQFFTEDEGEEEALLIKYKKALDEMDILVSYNGNGFDFPYLKKRLQRHLLDDCFERVLSLDMFSVLHKHSNFREIIPNLKQVTVEEYLGLKEVRKDTIDGGQSVQLFFRYLENKSDALRDTMLLHNRDDVLQLSRILWAFDKLNIHKIASHTGFPVVVDSKKVFVTGIRLKSKKLHISGRYVGITGQYDIFRDDCNVSLTPSIEADLLSPESDYGKIEIKLPLRYAEQISFLSEGDLNETELLSQVFNLCSNGALNNGQEFVELKKEGESNYSNINILVKHLVRDILNNL